MPDRFPTGEQQPPAATHAQDEDEIVRKPRLVMRDPQQASFQSVSAFDLPDLERVPGGTAAQAQRVLAEARESAEQMIQQARLARDAELDAARREGYAAGYAEGIEAADRDMAGLLATSEAIAANVAREREDLLVQAEGEIVSLALAIAQRLVNASLDVDPALVVDVCRGAMRKAFQRDTLVVLAHPDDLAMLRAAGPAMAQELGGIHQLDFVEERRLERGSVIVRTPAGEIDGTLGGKSTKVEESLRELVEARRAGRRTADAEGV